MTNTLTIQDGTQNEQLADTLAARFAQACRRFPEHIAVTFEQTSTTYAELDRHATAIAEGLRAKGAGPGKLVGICMERSLDLVATMLAVVKTGAAYLPLDPAYPQARLAETIADATPVLVVGPGFISIAQLLASISQPNQAQHQATPGQPAYVIYTSGSTGKPKGVVVTQHNLLRLFDSTEPWFHFNQHDVWTMFHSFAFDFSVWEMWGALLHGGRLVIVPFATSRSPEDFRALLLNERVTILNQTPSAFALLSAADAAAKPAPFALRTIVFGGEALAPGSLAGWIARHGDQSPQLINMYGITETTVHVTYRRMLAEHAASEQESLIGEPIQDLTLHLLNESLTPVAPGEEGEICIGGAGVAQGYLNRPELTAERFVADPLNPGQRLYRSGDIARRRADGELVYLGRRDGQVKIAGFRIELAEIEAALTLHPKVAQACVTAAPDSTAGTRLAAYVVPRDPAATPATAELSAWLAERLPSHMRPALYQLLPTLPLTINGKVDRVALPAIGSPRVSSNAPTGTSLEQRVAAIWQQALGVSTVSLDDNFFDIGGTSLLLISVRAALKAELAREIPIVWMFECTTVRTLAARLNESPAKLPAADTAAQDKARQQKMAFARARAARGPHTANRTAAEGGAR